MRYTAIVPMKGWPHVTASRNGGGYKAARRMGPWGDTRPRTGACPTGITCRHGGDHWTLAWRLAASISALETRPFLALDCMLPQASAW